MNDPGRADPTLAMVPKTPTSSKTPGAASSGPPPPPPVAGGSAPSRRLWLAYKKETPERLKLVDAFLVFILLSGIAQFLYLVLVTDYPFNAFLAGYVAFFRLCVPLSHVLPGGRFASTVGQFVLTASLRSQVNPANKVEFKDVSPERYETCSSVSMTILMV